MNSFEDWYDENLRDLLKGNLRGGLLAAWEAAQEAERNRHRAFIANLIEHWKERPEDELATRLWLMAAQNEAVKTAMREVNDV
jgi:hypothetical protein